MKNNLRRSSGRSRAAKSSVFTPALTKRIVLYGILILILCAAQCSFFSRLKPFGATPDLLLGMLVAIILLDSPSAAAICAVAAGYMIDSIGAVPPSFSPLYYLACVAYLAAISAKMLPRFVSFCLLLSASLMGRAAFTFISLFISGRAFPSMRFFFSTAISEAVSTLVFCLPIYFLVKFIASVIGARKKFDFT